jgi:hypothetical protein
MYRLENQQDDMAAFKNLNENDITVTVAAKFVAYVMCAHAMAAGCEERLLWSSEASRGCE